jgi:hypothetical protein
MRAKIARYIFFGMSPTLKTSDGIQNCVGVPTCTKTLFTISILIILTHVLTSEGSLSKFDIVNFVRSLN